MLLSPPAVSAGRCYKAEPVKGSDGKAIQKLIPPVCRALEANLNEFCDQPPMVCELKIHPRHARELSLPKWEPVDLDGSVSLLEELIRAPWKNSVDPTAGGRIWEDARPDIEGAFNEGRLRVSTARLDLYQTGIKAKTYRYDLGDCRQKNKYLELTNEGGAWEVRLRPAEVHVELGSEEYWALEKLYSPLARSSFASDIFLFRGQPFSYYMFGFTGEGESPDSLPHNEVRVDQGKNYLLRGEPTTFFNNVCHLKYQPTRTTK